MRKEKQFDLKTFITWTLRKASYRTKARSEALRNARVERNTYKCAACQKLFPNKEVQVDHIEPIVDPVKGFTTWDEYISRMFVSADKLQILCRPCHKEKSNRENQARRESAN